MARMYQPQLGAQIQQGISNLGDLFAPPSAQDAYLSAKLKADQAAAEQKKASAAALDQKYPGLGLGDFYGAGASDPVKAAVQADLYRRAGQPGVTPQSLQNQVFAIGHDYGKLPASQSQAEAAALAQKQAELRSQEARNAATIKGETDRALLAPVAAGATRFVPKSMADMYGVPQTEAGNIAVGEKQLVYPQGGGQPLTGPAPQPTVDSTKAELLKGLPPELQQAILLGNTNLQKVVDPTSGMPKLTYGPQAVGQTPYERPTTDSVKADILRDSPIEQQRYAALGHPQPVQVAGDNGPQFVQPWEAVGKAPYQRPSMEEWKVQTLSDPNISPVVKQSIAAGASPTTVAGPDGRPTIVPGLAAIGSAPYEKPQAPVSVGGALVDPTTGRTIYEKPQAPVSVGGALVDPTTGRTIYEKPPQPTTDSLAAQEIAKTNGAGSPVLEALQRYRQSQQPAKAPKPSLAEINQQREVEAARLGLQGEDRLQYITSGKIPTQGEKQTGEQANAATFATRMREAEKILADPKIASAGLGVKGGMQDVAASIPFVGNAMLSPEYQQLDQAKRDFVNAVLRKESGAAISQGEFDNAEKQYFPRPGDSPQVIAQKAHNRRTAMETIANAGGPAFRKQFFGGQQPTQSPGPQTSQNPGPAASTAGPDIANMPIEQLSTLDPAKLTTEQLQAVVARRRALMTAQQAQ